MTLQLSACPWCCLRDGLQTTALRTRRLIRILEETVKNVFDQYLSPKQFRNVVEYFENGKSLEVGERVTADEYLRRTEVIRGFREQITRVAAELAGGSQTEQLQASVAELILDGLYCHNRLNKKRKIASATYGL